jgi:putative flippase GtrA
MVGVVNTTIDVSLFGFFVHVLNWNLLPANITSYSAGIVNSFVMNKFWTFQDQKPLAHSIKAFATFVLISMTSLVVSSASVWAFAQYLDQMFAKLGSVAIVFAWNYSLTRLLVFTTPTR